MNTSLIWNWVIDGCFLIVGISIGKAIERAKVYKKAHDAFVKTQQSLFDTMKELSQDERVKYIAYLFVGHLKETLTSKEQDDLDEWVGASDKNMRLFEELTNEDNIAVAMDYLENIQNDNKDKPQA